jgi:hypothetical protein
VLPDCSWNVQLMFCDSYSVPVMDLTTARFRTESSVRRRSWRCFSLAIPESCIWTSSHASTRWCLCHKASVKLRAWPPSLDWKSCGSVNASLRWGLGYLVVTVVMSVHLYVYMTFCRELLFLVNLLILDFKNYQICWQNLRMCMFHWYC